jgi:NAD dependent epimerase/dehydratase
MDLSGKRILVTGADGFIGSHLVEALVRRGLDVRAFVFYNSFHSWGWLDRADPAIRDGLDVFAGDVRDPHGVRTAMAGCQVVLHLAALIGIPYSYHSPDNYVDTNVRGTLNVVQAARDLGVEKVVLTSTAEVYGTAQFVPVTEEHPLRGQSPYGASKIGADQIGLSFYTSFDTPVAVIRLFNTFGPRQSARAVIPTIITQIAAGAHEVRLGALRPTRDFNFVADTVAGFVRVAERDEAVGEVINVGSGRETSIGDLARTIAEAMGVEVAITLDAQRLRPEKSEVDRLRAGIGKAERLLGYRPAYGGPDGLRRGLAETIAWFTRPENLAGYKPHLYAV